MIWPFISRRDYESQVAVNVKLVEEVGRLTGLLDSSVRHLVEMRREGFNPAPVVPVVEQKADPLPTELRVAIDQRAVPRSKPWRQLYAFALSQTENGVPTDVIKSQILEGSGA